jgi:hypothetical protein
MCRNFANNNRISLFEFGRIFGRRVDKTNKLIRSNTAKQIGKANYRNAARPVQFNQFWMAISGQDLCLPSFLQLIWVHFDRFG